jgi:hypothetical protein
MNRYRWNTSLIEPFAWMSLKGIRWDSAEAGAMRSSLTPRAWAAQAVVDELAGVALPTSTEALLSAIAAAHCHKVKVAKQLRGYKVMAPVLCEDGSPKLNKKGKPVRKAHAIAPRALSWQLVQETANLAGPESIARIHTLWQGEPSPSVRAEIAALLGIGVNVESPDQVVDTLDRLGLPAKWKRGARRDDDAEAGRTADEEALLGLFIATGHPMTKAILEARSLRTALSFLDSMTVDPDGRVRCSFANPGSETGRVLTRTWHSGSGGNLQAVSAEPFNFRRLLAADEGHLLAQVDLRGADGWTVAARCAQHGDPTMLLDLKAGIRIPSLLALLMGGAVFPPSFDRAELRKLCKAVVKDWRDYAFKKAQHLSNYLGSPQLIQRETVRESWSATGTPIDPGLEFCRRVQQLYLARYWGLRAWWADVERQVRRNGTLEGASGQVRDFLSRRWTGEGASRRLDHSCHKEAVASEPQMVTTYSTNLALWRLWTDPHQWLAGASDPVVQPLLHIHDALLVQFPVQHLAPVGAKLSAWFDNPIHLGNVVVNIPQAAAYGPSWGQCDTSFPPYLTT